MQDINQIWANILGNPSQALAALAAFGSLLAGIASLVAAHGSQRAANVMREDMLLRQRPYVFVDRSEAEIIKSGELYSRFFIHNNGALPAKVKVHAKYTLDNAVVRELNQELVIFAGQERRGNLEPLNKAEAERVQKGERVLGLDFVVDYSSVGHHKPNRWEYYSNATFQMGVHGTIFRYLNIASDAN